jgi:hypothetical protein
VLLDCKELEPKESFVDVMPSSATNKLSAQPEDSAETEAIERPLSWTTYCKRKQQVLAPTG